MIGFHLQRTVPDWPQAVALLPVGAWVKAVDGVQWLSEAKGVNPGCNTVLRHWYDAGQIFGGNHEELKERARLFFGTFVDETFRQNAHNVDAVEGWNEYLANSQNSSEVQDRVNWARAVNEVWTDEYRSQTEYRHIQLVTANAAIGNDIPLEMARIVAEHGGLLGYHAYIPIRDNVIKPDGLGAWTYYAGRFAAMDANYREAGVYVDWLFTEGGAVGWYDGGHLGPNDGWRRNFVHSGDVERYIEVSLKWFVDGVTAWNAQHGGRAKGLVLFTTGGGDWWDMFEVRQPEMNRIAAWVAGYAPEPPPVDEIALTFRPCQTTRITQRFGDNPQNYEQFGLPGHEGIDYGVGQGLPFYAAVTGRVVHASDRRWSTANASSYGWHVVVDHGSFCTVYAHAAADLPVTVGQIVQAGEVVGRSGNTGNSTGYHLHFGLLAKHSTGNGYPMWTYGQPIDPAPYLAGKDAPPDMGDLERAIFDYGKENVWLNNDAALQVAIMNDEWTVAGPEMWTALDGESYATQAAVHPNDRTLLRVYYARVPMG